MYIKDRQEVPNPDSTSGLYIRRQDGTTVQVKVPADHIAFQMGEAMQVGSLSKEWLLGCMQCISMFSAVRAV